MPDHTYAQEDVLVSTQWVADNLHRTDKVRIVESNEDVLLYGTGHIPNAVHIDWVADLNDAIRRDYLNEEQFATLMGRAGIDVYKRQPCMYVLLYIQSCLRSIHGNVQPYTP